MGKLKRIFVKILNPLIFIVALILIFEEWLWTELTRFTRFISELPFLAKLEFKISMLPAYPSLILLISPFLLLLPLKFLMVFLVSNGHYFVAFVLFILEKILGTALAAHLFSLTKKNVMTIAWFQRFFDKLVNLISLAKNWIKEFPVYHSVRRVIEKVKARYSRSGFVARKISKYRKQK